MKSIDTHEASRAATIILIGLAKFTLNVAIVGSVVRDLLR
jgi:hypothetical protein